MECNYQIVLFKNNKKEKIIKKYVTYQKCYRYYENLLKKSEDVIFPINFENGLNVNFELAILEYGNSQIFPIYITDEVGRNLQVDLSNSDWNIIKIKTYNLPERIYDIFNDKKLTFEEFISHVSKPGLKLISKLNNKLIYQNDDNFELFSLKTNDECKRFFEILERYLIENNKSDFIIVQDVSKAQKKYLYDLLSRKGIPKKKLYRTSTTHPREK
jgi:hypothetical protein